jgi:hypothetical protein
MWKCNDGGQAMCDGGKSGNTFEFGVSRGLFTARFFPALNNLACTTGKGAIVIFDLATDKRSQGLSPLRGVVA